MDNKGSQGEDTDDEGGHYVVEGVELRLAAQYQCVLDVGESLQNLENDNFLRRHILCQFSMYSREILIVQIQTCSFNLLALQHSSHSGFLFWQRCTSNRLYLEEEV